MASSEMDLSEAEAAAQKDRERRGQVAHVVERNMCPVLHVAENCLFLPIFESIMGF